MKKSATLRNGDRSAPLPWGEAGPAAGRVRGASHEISSESPLTLSLSQWERGRCCIPSAWPLALFFAALILGAGPTLAVDRRTPDWPCQQVKVPELSAAAAWPEPLPQNEEKATEIPGLNDLTAELAARRTPIEEAEKKIESFITGTPEERKEKADLLFLGLFDALNAQRFQVMNGIERAYRSQKGLAEKIRSDAEKLRALQDANSDAPQLKELLGQVQWETRIFDDRRKTLKYACEVPVEIDQRIFALARAIQKAGGIS